ATPPGAPTKPAGAAPTEAKPVAVQPTAAGTSGLPRVYLWSNMVALAKPEGSDPDKLQAVRKVIMDGAKVEPIPYVPPPGAAGQEKLNLTLGSRSEELDVFQGNWDEYKEAVQPLNEL